MKFTKMHGCGNDYIYVNCFQEEVKNPEELAIRVSDYRFGIGSDGLILIKPSHKADFTMDMYNADGSRGKMCGNGIRCVGKYVYDHGMTDKTEISVETLSGIKYLTMDAKNGKIVGVRVDMGAPVLKPELVPVNLDGERVVSREVEVDGEKAVITCVSMGNPHAVIFVEDAENAPVHTFGPKLECSSLFPDKANIEFCRVISRTEVRMRVWERGSGETWACGTGACATVMACILNGKTENKVLVHMNGGDVVIEYDTEKNTVFMTGPAETVCEGDYML
ncbi:MAG: diaminopimelate epimerase [Lachnospiraceae bacterium]